MLLIILLILVILLSPTFGIHHESHSSHHVEEKSEVSINLNLENISIYSDSAIGGDWISNR